MAAGMQMVGASPTPFAMSPWPYSFVGERDVVRMLLVGDLGRGKPGWIVPDRLRPLLAHEDPCKTEEVPRHGPRAHSLGSRKPHSGGGEAPPGWRGLFPRSPGLPFF